MEDIIKRLKEIMIELVEADEEQLDALGAELNEIERKLII